MPAAQRIADPMAIALHRRTRVDGGTVSFGVQEQ